MHALALSDLNTTINHEPRILDLTIAERLGMIDRHQIRSKIIATNRDELENYGGVSVQRTETSARGGRPSIAYYLNEAQALLVCMFSRTPKAAEVRKQIIDVFQAYRRGEAQEETEESFARWERDYYRNIFDAYAGVTLPDDTGLAGFDWCKGKGDTLVVRPVFKKQRRANDYTDPRRRRWERWLTPNDREEMRGLWASGAWTLGQLAERYSMSITGVRGHVKDLERYSART